MRPSGSRSSQHDGERWVVTALCYDLIGSTNRLVKLRSFVRELVDDYFRCAVVPRLQRCKLSIR